MGWGWLRLVDCVGVGCGCGADVHHGAWVAGGGGGRATLSRQIKMRSHCDLLQFIQQPLPRLMLWIFSQKDEEREGLKHRSSRGSTHRIMVPFIYTSRHALACIPQTKRSERAQNNEHESLGPRPRHRYYHRRRSEHLRLCVVWTSLEFGQAFQLCVTLPD